MEINRQFVLLHCGLINLVDIKANFIEKNLPEKGLAVGVNLSEDPHS